MEVAKQLAVFLENKPGALARTCEALLEDKINVLAVSVSDGVDHAVVRLVVDHPEKAIHLLEDRGLLVVDNEVLLLDADNKPGMLLEVAKALTKVKVNIEYLYCAVRKTQKKGVVVLRPSNIKKAMKALEGIC